MNELSTKDFLKEPLDTFNKHSKSKKYNDILKDGRESYHDVKDMLIEEGVIDKNRYDELLEEKAEFDKNEEIARKNIEKLMEDEAKEEYKLNEETLKRLDDNNFKRSFNELTGEYTLYSTIPDKNGNEVELINYYDYDDSPAMIHHVMEDVEDFNNFKSQMDIVRMFKINDEFKDCKVNVSEIGYMESPLKVELDRGKLRNSKLTFLVDNDGDNVNLKTQINESYTTVLNMDALFDGKLSGRDLTNMNGFTRAKDNWEITKCDEKSDIMESVNRLTKDNNFHSDYYVANELKDLGLIDDKLHEEITDYRFKEDMKQLRNPENQRKQYEAYMNILGRKKEVGYINLPRVINDFNENNIKAVYNEENDNYDIISTRPNYKGEEYKILSCDKNGIVETNAYDMDLDLMSDYSNFYGLQTIKSDSKYKNFNFEFNVERTAKVRELTKPSNAVVEDEDEDANEDDVELSIKQACFENIIRKITEQNKGMER